MNALRLLRGLCQFYGWLAMEAIDGLRRGVPAGDASDWTDGTWD